MRFVSLILWLSIFYLSAGAAEAGPLAAAFTVVTGLLKAGGIAAAIIKGVFGLALQFGVSLIEKAQAKKRQQKMEPRGVSLQVKVGDDQPSQFIVGTYATAGIRKYIGTWGQAGKTPNAYLTDVIELSCIPSPGLAGIWIDDTKGEILWNEPSPHGLGYPVKEFRIGGADYAWVRFVDGTQTVADPWLRATFGNHHERPFKATMIGRGCAFAVVTFRYNQDKFGGLPQCLFELLPRPWYDLRKDSTNGGSGPQRWTDQSTWEPTDNNEIIIYNLIRGVYYGDEWVFGGQNLAAFRLPASNVIAAANECDRLVDKSTGGQEKQFRCGYEVRLDMEPLAVIDELRQACNARIAEVGGVFKTLVGAPGAAVYSFTDADVVVTKGQSYEPFPSLAETHNGIEATYPEPAEKWASKDAPARYSAELEAADGYRRLVTGIAFPAAPFALQVQRLMKAMIEEERRFRIHFFQLPPDAFALEPNDVVSWTSARNGYENKKFLMIRVVGSATMNQLVVLKEIDPSDYGWSPADELPTGIGWLGPITAPPQPMTGWAVEPSEVVDDGGVARRPAILISCAPDLDDVARVHVIVRVKATGAVVFDSDQTPYPRPNSNGTYQWTISGAWCLPNVRYEARGRYVPYSNRAVDWSDWLEVLTRNIRLGDADVFAPGMIADLQKYTRDATEWLREGTRQLLHEQGRIARLIAEQDFANFRDKQTLRRELVSRSDQITASYSELIVAATGPGSAIVGRLETLEVKIPTLATVTALNSLTAVVTQQGNTLTAQGQQLTSINAVLPNKAEASAVNSLSARVTNAEGSITANSNAITSVDSKVGKVSANGTFRVSTEAAPSGALARVAIAAAITDAGASYEAAFFLDAMSGGKTRAVFKVGQFAIIDPNSTVPIVPFVVENGVVRMVVTHVGLIKSGRIESFDGKSVWDLDAGYQSYSDNT